jgi:hypothetical protein
VCGAHREHGTDGDDVVIRTGSFAVSPLLASLQKATEAEAKSRRSNRFILKNPEKKLGWFPNLPTLRMLKKMKISGSANNCGFCPASFDAFQ